MGILGREQNLMDHPSRATAKTQHRTAMARLRRSCMFCKPQSFQLTIFLSEIGGVQATISGISWDINGISSDINGELDSQTSVEFLSHQSEFCLVLLRRDE